MPEVTFINRNDDGVFNKELSQQSTDPQSLLIVEGVSVLNVRFLKALVPKLESLLHYLPNDSGGGHLLSRHHIHKVLVDLLTSVLIDTLVLKVRGHSLNESWVLALGCFLFELQSSLPLRNYLFKHLLSED